MDTISRVQAAACVTAARTAVFAQAEVHTPPRSAAEWAFARLYDALAENLTASGRDNVSVTYRHLALLASNRGKGKTIKASSLRKPFSENFWRGSLLENPFQHDGVTLDLRLSPAGRRGRPLILSAFFSIRGVPARIEAGNPNGNQPILEEARLAEDREARLAHQAGVARRFIDTLRETGFERADDLSRWFARRGIHIAPSIIIAILVIALCAATASAVALIRYIVLHNILRLEPNPSEQGHLPLNHHPRGDLVRVEEVKNGRVETRLAPGAITWTLFPTDLQFTRRYPDSDFNFEWTITVDGRTTKKTTTIPEVEYPDDGAEYSVAVERFEVRHYKGRIRTPDVAEHVVDQEEDRGWISGAACVLPRPGYARGRPSPIDAVVLSGRRVRFTIRHGPARVRDVILKFSFGDGTVWSSSEQVWTISEAPGDEWDRYQTALEHVYSRPGHYDIRFALFRAAGKGRECFREGIGQVYVDVPPPTAVPIAQRSPLLNIPVPAGATSVIGEVIDTDVLGKPPPFHIAFEHYNDRVVTSQVLALSVRNDPHSVALGVVPPANTSVGPNCPAYVDYGDGSPPEGFARVKSTQGTYLIGFHEFLRSGVYPITITVLEPSSRKELFVFRRNLQVAADAPPQITTPRLP